MIFLDSNVAIRRRDAIGPSTDALLGLADEIFPVEVEDVLRARDLLAGAEQLPARDAIHVAVMRRYGVRCILSFDAGFDGVEGIERIAE